MEQLKKVLVIVIAISLSTSSFARDCSKPVQAVKAETIVPCDGYLFSPDKEAQVRKAVEDNNLLQQELDIQKTIAWKYQKMANTANDIYDDSEKKAELWRVRAEDSTKKLMERQSADKWENALWFTLGVLATVGASRALNQLGK